MTTYDHVGVMLAHAALETGQQVRVRVNGTSMRPLVNVGDHVWVEPVSFAALHPGDVVTVWHDGGLLTHRVLKMNARGCITKGDNCVANDEPIAATQIVGRVVVVERRDRQIDLHRRRWQFVNRSVARLSVMEAAMERHPLRSIRGSSFMVRVMLRGLLWVFIGLEDR